MNRNLKHLVLPILAIAAVVLSLCGCESNPTEPDTGDPGPGPMETAPTLPDPERLTFEFSFFASAEKMAKAGRDNFFNAYLRVVVIDLMVKYYLTPPIAAFSLALHTPPSPQEDGSWIWVYTWVNGEEEVQIRLRGLPVGDNVQWQLWVDAPSADPPIEDALWFEGETHGDGQFGQWTFHDFTIEGNPAVATLEWGTGLDGDYLILTSLHGEYEDDSLAFHNDSPLCSIIYTDASEPTEWFIRWNEEDGSGSLMVPEYNDGQEACWDEQQFDTECEPLP